MNFLETILTDLKHMQIQYEEHYDPGPMQLFVLYLRSYANPSIVYAESNPNEVFLAIFIVYSHQQIGELEDIDKYQRQSSLQAIGMNSGLLCKVGLQEDVFHASLGCILKKKNYSKTTLKDAINRVIMAYDTFIGLASEILHDE